MMRTTRSAACRRNGGWIKCVAPLLSGGNGEKNRVENVIKAHLFSAAGCSSMKTDIPTVLRPRPSRTTERKRAIRLAVALLSISHAYHSIAADKALVDSIERDLAGGSRGKRGQQPANSSNLSTVDRFFEARTRRGRNLQDENELYEATARLPQRDFEINFEFNSWTIRPDAKPILDALGEALSRDNLKGNRIVIYGHTDNVGSWDYNKKLSQLRADEVARYLIDNFKLDPQNLYAVGFAFDKLKNRSDPRSSENRRVQVINGGSKPAATP